MSVTLDVQGMKCDGCEQSVEDALADVDGVTEATADHTTDSVTVDGDAGTDELVAAIESVGFDASV